MEAHALVLSEEVSLEMTSSVNTPVPSGLKAYARFLLPHVIRPVIAEMAARGPTEADLPLLSRFAPTYPDADIHRMILAALSRALPPQKLGSSFLQLYKMPGPGRSRRRKLIREVLAAKDPASLASLWLESETSEKLDLISRLRRMKDQSLERFMSQLTISDDHDPIISCLSVDVWQRLDDEAAVRILLKRLSRRNPRLRAQSLEALTIVLDRDEARRLLVRCVEDQAPLPRAAALAGLARLGDPRGRAGLATMLSSQHIEVQVAAQTALKKLAQPLHEQDPSFSSAPRARRGGTLRMPAIRAKGASSTDVIPKVTR